MPGPTELVRRHLLLRMTPTIRLMCVNYLRISTFPDSYKRVLLYRAEISILNITRVAWDRWFSVSKGEECKKHF